MEGALKVAVPEAPSINSATSLSLEATYINQNFGFQSVIEKPPPATVDFEPTEILSSPVDKRNSRSV